MTRWVSLRGYSVAQMLTALDDPRNTVDVSYCNLQGLPKDVRAELFSEADEFIALELRTSGNIIANQAKIVRLPLLQRSGNIEALFSLEVNLPQLEESGDIITPDARLSAPLLKKSGEIDNRDYKPTRGERSLNLSSGQPIGQKSPENG